MTDTHLSPQLKPAKLYWWTKEGLAVLAVRSMWRYWITGRELRGPGDNATFFHDATVDYRGRPYEKLTRARWRRVARRWLVAGIPATLSLFAALADVVRSAASDAPAWSTWPWGWSALAYLGALALTGLALGWRALAAWWPTRELRRDFVKPAAEVLLRMSGVKLAKRKAMKLIVLPPGFGKASNDPHERPASVRVYMPAAIPLSDARKAEFTRELGQRLGLPNAQGSWTVVGERAYVDLRAAALPPAEVSFADMREALEAATIDRPVAGMANGRKIVHLDYGNDSPHVLVSAGSGAGKSTLIRWIGMQRMHHGAYAVVLDFKKWSHLRWMRGLGPDRALYFHEIEDIHYALCAVMEEIIRRKEIDDEIELASLRPLDVYVEEMNTLVGMLRDWWRAYVAEQKAQAREAMRQAKAYEDDDAMAEASELTAKANGLPLISPAIQALRYGVNLGREFSAHFYFIGQSMSGNASGGRDTRESFRSRFLGRWDAKTWKMLAEGVPFVQCPSGPVGLWALVSGTTVDILRVPYVSDVQAREHVLSGTCPGQPVLSMDIGGHLGTPDTGHVLEGFVVPTSRLVSLSDVLSILPDKRDGQRMSLKALQLAAHRRYRTGFPAPVEQGGPGKADLYDSHDILTWFADRERLELEGPDEQAA